MSQLVFKSKAGSKDKRYWPVKLKSYLLSYFWPWWLSINALVGALAIEFTNSATWETTTFFPDGVACFALVMFWIFFGFLGGMFTLMDGEFGKKNYRERISATPQAKPTRTITAKLDEEAGKIDVYRVDESITGRSMRKLESFNPDQEDEILNYVNEKRAELEGADYTDARALVKVINN